MNKLSPKKKKKKHPIRFILCLTLGVFILLIALLLYKPTWLTPIIHTPDPNDPQPLHPHLTELYSDLHNGLQKTGPFELILKQKELNEAIARARWPQETGGIWFTAPQVYFSPEGITVAGLATIEDVNVALSLYAQPQLDDQGQLILHIEYVKIGAMGVTPVAKHFARKAYEKELAPDFKDPNDIRAQVAKSLLEDAPFEPVFEHEGKKARLTEIRLEAGKVVLGVQRYKPETGKLKPE